MAVDQRGPVAVTGAGGFVGSHLIPMLRAAGLAVRAVVRSTHDIRRLREMGCEVALADVRDQASLRTAFGGCRAVVHLVAILREKPGETFDAINRQGTAYAAAAARSSGARRFVHLSALGAAPGASRYLQSKWQGEEAVRAAGVPYVIFRPSFLIGSGGGAAAQFADVVRFGLWYPLVLLVGGRRVFGALAQLLPVVPVLGSGQSRSMPVAVRDVMAAVCRSLERDDVLGQGYEIGGPEVLTYDALLDTVARALRLRRVKVHLPSTVARAALALFALMPNPPITRDEAQALLADNLCDPAPASRTFGLRLTPFEQALGEALDRFGEKR